MSTQIKSLTVGIPVLDHPGMEEMGPNTSFNRISEANKVYTLYKAATGKSAVVKGMRFVNRHTVAVTVSIWFNRPVIIGEGPNRVEKYRRRPLAPENMSLPPGFTYIDDGEITMEPDDKIQAQAGTANVIDYVISGIERDVI